MRAVKPLDFGLEMRGQFPAGYDMQQAVAELLEQARTAWRLGFTSICKSQHYSSTPFQEIQQIPFLARLAAEVPGMRLVTGINLLSLHKPLDIAEQVATLDVISGGHVVFGAGLGYRDVEFKAFGVARREAVRRLEENLEALKRLWTEDEVSMVASHFELDGASCSTKPVQTPRVPIWLGANADVAIRRAARLADSWMINPHNRIDTIERQLDVYRHALDDAGKPFPDELPCTREIFVADSREAAVQQARPYLEAKYRAYHAWGQDKAMPAGDNDLGQTYDDLLQDRFVMGTADQVAGQLASLVRRLGVTRIGCAVQWVGMPQGLLLEQLHRLAEEVFPRVRQAI